MISLFYNRILNEDIFISKNHCAGAKHGDKVVVEGKEYLSETNNTIKIVE